MTPVRAPVDLRTLPAIIAHAEAEASVRQDGLANRWPSMENCPPPTWASMAPAERQFLIDVELDLLCDLSRPASRDVVARLVVVAMGGLVDDGAILHRSWRGYYELWALWPNERGVFTFRSIEFVPWADIREADPRFSPLWVKPATYLSDGSVERKAITDPAEALRLIATHVLRGPDV